jgi:hypothetical protein
MVAVIAPIAGIMAFVAMYLGTFRGRSINVLTAADPSAQYRQEVRGRLLDAADWTTTRGFGFSEGNEVAHNPISGAISNVDHGWLYLLLALGSLAVLGLGALFLSLALRALIVDPAVGLATTSWVLLISLSENLFVLPGPCVCAVLLIACVRSRGSPGMA